MLLLLLLPLIINACLVLGCTRVSSSHFYLRYFLLYVIQFSVWHVYFILPVSCTSVKALRHAG